ncbi:MAG: RlmE family RNA methyltransferase [Alphaproteobacteria bacterium]
MTGRSSGRSSGRGARRLKVKVRTARGRTISSTRWLQRQLNDPYVADAKRAGYRSRAAWKLTELDDKLHLLKRGARVVDLGAAPGGWTQVAVERVGRGGEVIAVDCNEMEPVDRATMLQLDMTDADAPDRIREALGGPVDVVLSDMAAPVTGHRQTDHLRTVTLCEAAADFAGAVLKPGGAFVTKVFQGGAEGTLLADLKRLFAQVRHVKPPASRDSSPETYLVATGFRG